MTYALERAAIETYFAAQWGAITPVGWDGQAFEPPLDGNGDPLPAVRLTITSGATRQGSIGRLANRIDHLGLLTITIFTAGGAGSAAWRSRAETIMGLFFGKTLDQTGALITATSQAFIRFSPPELGDNRHPYVAADFADPPFHLTNVIAPFTRYAYR